MKKILSFFYHLTRRTDEQIRDARKNTYDDDDDEIISLDKKFVRIERRFFSLRLSTKRNETKKVFFFIFLFFYFSFEGQKNEFDW